MIDPKELRLGNWVLFKREPWDNGEYRQVKGIDSHIDLATPNCKLATMMASKENVYPIQLTEKILHGIKWDEVREYENGYKTFHFGNFFVDFDGCVMVDMGEKTPLISASRNLHIFQNIYFCLTFKELNITL